MNVTIGRIVHYVLTEFDAATINNRRTTGPEIRIGIQLEKWPIGAQAHIGSKAEAGQHVAAMVVSVSPNSCNLQCYLDGTDVYWMTSVTEGDAPGTWHFPERS